MKKLKQSVINFFARQISRLSVQHIYMLPKYVGMIIAGIAIVWGIFTFISYLVFGTFTPLILYILLVLFSMQYTKIFTCLISASVQYIFLVRVDINKWLAYSKYSFEKNRNAKKLLLYQLSMVLVEYYKGEFENCFDLAKEIDTVQLNHVEDGELVLNIVLIKSAAMLNNDTTFEQYYSNLRNQENMINDLQVNILTQCQAIKKICLEQTLVDTLDNWQPESSAKLLLLEKNYFQALNEQLKGNDTKAASLFKALSQENPDLFFVREAKQYLEENYCE